MKILKIINALVLVSGITLTVANAMVYKGAAELTGGGAAVLHSAAATKVLTQERILPAVMESYAPASAADEFVIGILLILLGFFLHASIASYEKNAERNVPITVVPGTPKRERKGWFWIEMRL